jgi:hypothetical protein
MAVFKGASSLLVDSQHSDRNAVRGNWTWVQLDFTTFAPNIASAGDESCVQSGKRSPPAEARRDVLQDRLDHVCGVVDAELVGYGEQQRIGLSDGLIRLELRDESIKSLLPGPSNE